MHVKLFILVENMTKNLIKLQVRDNTHDISLKLIQMSFN